MNERISKESSLDTIQYRDFPVLKANDVLFPNGRYAVSFEATDKKNSFRLLHKIYGVPLISRLIEENAVRYVCSVSSPKASYRHTYISKEPIQTISWNPDDLGEAPSFSPMIVSIVNRKIELNQYLDGIPEIWHGKHIDLAKGNRLALGKAFHLWDSMLYLIRLKENKSLKQGTFKIKIVMEQDFEFLVDINTNLKTFLNHKESSIIRNNMMTHIVSACLGHLKHEGPRIKQKTNYRRLAIQNLDNLAKYLKNKTGTHWNDDNFCPEYIATNLYPLEIPTESLSTN